MPHVRCGNPGCNRICPKNVVAEFFNSTAVVCYEDFQQHDCSTGSVCGIGGFCVRPSSISTITTSSTSSTITTPTTTSLNNNNKTVCDNGWRRAPACDEPICSNGCLHTFGAGICVAPDNCICSAGRNVLNCEAPCPAYGGNCNGNGVCVDFNVCKCSDEFVAPSCTAPYLRISQLSSTTSTTPIDVPFEVRVEVIRSMNVTRDDIELASQFTPSTLVRFERGGAAIHDTALAAVRSVDVTSRYWRLLLRFAAIGEYRVFVLDARRNYSTVLGSPFVVNVTLPSTTTRAAPPTATLTSLSANAASTGNVTTTQTDPASMQVLGAMSLLAALIVGAVLLLAMLLGIVGTVLLVRRQLRKIDEADADTLHVTVEQLPSRCLSDEHERRRSSSRLRRSTLIVSEPTLVRLSSHDAEQLQQQRQQSPPRRRTKRSLARSALTISAPTLIRDSYLSHIEQQQQQRASTNQALTRSGIVISAPTLVRGSYAMLNDTTELRRSTRRGRTSSGDNGRQLRISASAVNARPTPNH